jgi:hypothetical protein
MLGNFSSPVGALKFSYFQVSELWQLGRIDGEMGL